MMPSVAVHGGTRRHHRDPAIRLSAAGWEGLFALKVSRSARPAGPGQQRSLCKPKPVLSAGRSKILLPPWRSLSTAAVWLSLLISGGIARAGHAGRGDPVGCARIPLLLLKLVSALAQARQRRPGGVRKPPCFRDKLCEARTLLPLQEFQNAGAVLGHHPALLRPHRAPDLLRNGASHCGQFTQPLSLPQEHTTGA